MNITWCPLRRIEELQAFIDTHWRRGHILARDAELLRWQFPRTEQPDHLNVLIADDATGMQGMLGIIPTSFNDRGTKRTGTTLANWVVTEATRPQGLGLQLLKRVLSEDYAFVGALGGNPKTTLPMLKALKFSVWPSIPRWVRVFDREAFRSLVEPAGAEYSAWAQARWMRRTDPRKSTLETAGTRIIPWSEDAARRWNEAWVTRFAPQTRGTWRDAAFLHWRYLEHPRFRYDVQFAEQLLTGAIVGLLVSRRVDLAGRADKILRVVEFLADESAGDALAQEVIRQGWTGVVSFADFYCTAGRFAAPLERVGFEREEGDLQLPALFAPLEYEPAPLTGAFRVTPEVDANSVAYFNSSDLYFTRSDGDQDRPN
jgi:hypothetical protein